MKIKIHKNANNDFWSNLERKLICDKEICTFRVLTSTNTQKNRGSTIMSWQTGPEIQNHTDHFDVFPVPCDPFVITNRYIPISAPQNIFSYFVAVHIPPQTTSFVFIFGFCPILIFVLCTIWPHQLIELDLSCPEHFFRLRGDSYSVPNDRI